jgi:S1/P1 Nuclease
MASSLAQADPVRAAHADPQVWFDESEAAAETFAYAPPIGDGDGPYSLTEDYQRKAIEVAHVQAAVAGARLAALLNAALTGP